MLAALDCHANQTADTYLQTDLVKMLLSAWKPAVWMTPLDVGAHGSMHQS